MGLELNIYYTHLLETETNHLCEQVGKEKFMIGFYNYFKILKAHFNFIFEKWIHDFETTFNRYRSQEKVLISDLIDYTKYLSDFISQHKLETVYESISWRIDDKSYTPLECINEIAKGTDDNRTVSGKYQDNTRSGKIQSRLDSLSRSTSQRLSEIGQSREYNYEKEVVLSNQKEWHRSIQNFIRNHPSTIVYGFERYNSYIENKPVPTELRTLFQSIYPYLKIRYSNPEEIDGLLKYDWLIESHNYDAQLVREVSDQIIKSLKENIIELSHRLKQEINSNNFIGHILLKFKNRSLTWDQQRLKDIALEAESRQEKELTIEMCRFLFDQGLSPINELSLGNSRFDVILADSENKMLVEVKVLTKKTTRKTIYDGFKQLHLYLTKTFEKYKLNFGYLVCFRIEGNQYDIPEEVSLENFNLRTVYIDIADHSLKNEKITKLTKNEILENIAE